MIQAVSIRNFRTLQTLDATLGMVTAVVGDNNAGKTNLLRAISWALLNEAPPLEEIVTVGASEVSVEVHLQRADGVVVSVRRWRSAKVNACRLVVDGEIREFDKVGQGAIQEVVEAVGFGPVKVGKAEADLHRQGVTYPSILDLSAGDLQGVLAYLSGAGRVEQAARQAASKVRETGTLLRQAQVDLQVAEEEAAGLAEVPYLVQAVAALEAAQADVDTLWGRMVAARRLRVAWEPTVGAPSPADVEPMVAALQRIDTTADAAEDWAVRWYHVKGLRTRAQQAQVNVVDPQALDGLGQALSGLQASRAAVTAAASRVQTLHGLRGRWAAALQQEAQALQALPQAEADFHAALHEAGACPLCGVKHD